MPEYDQYLEEYVYSKIWSELSELDKKILTEIATSGEFRVKTIRENLNMKSELFSVYRERLSERVSLIPENTGRFPWLFPVSLNL